MAGDVGAVGALRAVVRSRRQRGRPRPRLEGWVEGWVEGLDEGVGEEVRGRSEREGRRVGRDRRGLRRGRVGVGAGGVDGSEGQGGVRREGMQESEDEGWEEEVVEAYRYQEVVEESEGSTGGRLRSEDFKSRAGNDERASLVDTVYEGGDADRSAEEYQNLLSPRPEPETPMSSRGSESHDWRPARDGRGSARDDWRPAHDTREMESDAYKKIETPPQNPSARKRRHK